MRFRKATIPKTSRSTWSATTRDTSTNRRPLRCEIDCVPSKCYSRMRVPSKKKTRKVWLLERGHEPRPSWLCSPSFNCQLRVRGSQVSRVTIQSSHRRVSRRVSRLRRLLLQSSTMGPKFSNSRRSLRTVRCRLGGSILRSSLTALQLTTSAWITFTSTLCNLWWGARPRATQPRSSLTGPKR